MIDRRQIKDRRKKPTKPISRYTFVGQRKIAQRFNESDNYYVDRYEWHLLGITGLIIVFCVLDVCFTLKICQLGGSESNLIMSFFMGKNMVLALITKFFITVVGSVFLLVHKNFKVFNTIKTHAFIYLIFLIYFVIVLYELGSLMLIKGI
jgi:hypothetical protein